MFIPDWLRDLEEGQSPRDPGLLSRFTAGGAAWRDPFITHYLDRYIKGENGVYGSKVKFLISNEGSGGKTHLLRLIVYEAQRRNFQAIYMKAGDLKLSYINFFYSAIINNLHFEALLSGYRDSVIRKLGYNPEEFHDTMPFIVWAQERCEAPEILRRDLRIELSRLLHNPRMDRNFALALIRITYGDLEQGLAWNEPERRLALLDWFAAKPKLSLTQIKKEEIFVKINRQNARRMLCSLAELVRLAGFSGLVVAIDELEDLLAPRLEGRKGGKHSKMAREDTYESIRDLIDEQESLQGALFIFASRRILIDDEARGFKIYPALWMRIREEITPREAFNPYVDLIDLDRCWYLQNKEEIVAILSESIFNLARESFPDMEFRPPDTDTLNSVLAITPFNIRQAIRILTAHLRRQFH